MSIKGEFKEITQKLLDKSMKDFIDLYNKGGSVNYSNDLQIRWVTLLQQALNENLVTQSSTNTDVSDILTELKTLNKNIETLTKAVNTNDAANGVKLDTIATYINGKLGDNTKAVNNVYSKVSNIDTNISTIQADVDTIKKK